MAGFVVFKIKILRVTLVKAFHKKRKVFRERRLEHQVHMIGHKTKSVERDLIFPFIFLNQRKKIPVILFIEECFLFLVPPGNDVIKNILC